MPSSLGRLEDLPTFCWDRPVLMKPAGKELSKKGKVRDLTSNEHRHSDGPGQQGQTQQPAAKTTTVARFPGGLVHIHLLPPQALLVLVNRHEVLRVLLLTRALSVSNHYWGAATDAIIKEI